LSRESNLKALNKIKSSFASGKKTGVGRGVLSERDDEVVSNEEE